MGRGADANQWSVFEDGIVALFTTTSWNRLCAAVSSGSPLEIRAMSDEVERPILLRWKAEDDGVAIVARH